MKIQRDRALFCLIDLQEKLFAHMQQQKRVENNMHTVLKGVRLFDLPIFVNEQYKKGIGATIESLQPLLTGAYFYEKTTFSACGCSDFVKDLKVQQRDQIIIAGTETHVCVLQTALDLLEAGYEVFIIESCCSSRDIGDKNLALQRLQNAGAAVVSVEMVLFELCGDAKDTEFKKMLKLVK